MAAKPDLDLEKLVAQDASDFIRELEVERVLRAFKLNPYDILDLHPSATDSDIKKQYRKKSLLIHPDKYKHEKGIEAFDQLKKAEAILSDKDKRADIDAVMGHARVMVLKGILQPGINTTTVPDDDPRLIGLDPPLDIQIRKKARDIFIEEELARRRAQKIAYANEGAEAAKKETEINEKKRKKQDEEDWELKRDERVSNWRDFAKVGNASGSGAGSTGSASGGTGKKVTKKKKLNVLG